MTAPGVIMVNQLASDINDAEEAELRRMEGGAPGSASSHQPPPPTKRPRTAPQQATTDELFIELVSWDPVGMPAGGDKAEVIASMLTNFAKCMADNAALLRQLHGRAQQAQAEELTLRVTENKTGYFGVRHHRGKPKPYEARVMRGAKLVSLGCFATAEEAALCVAGSPEGGAAAAAALASEEAQQQAEKRKRSKSCTNLKRNLRRKPSYQLFMAGEREALKASHPQLGPKEVVSEVVRRWQLLDQAAKAEWEAKVTEAEASEAEAAAAAEAEAEAEAEAARLKQAQLSEEEQKKARKKERKREKKAKKAAAEKAAAAPPTASPPPPASPLTSEEAKLQARAEGLTLRVAKSKTGYVGVYLKHQGLSHLPKRFEAQVRRGGKMTSIGYFATAEEAALCIARSPEGRAAAQGAAQQAAAAPVPLTSEEAQQQAQAEGLTLRVADNKTGYSGVYVDTRGGRSKPYMTQVKRRGGTDVSLGSFATAEEAALCVARSPEGRAAAAAAKQAAAAAAKRAAAAAAKRAAASES